MERRVYWSVESCAWERSPAPADLLTTPWSRTGVPVPHVPHPVDAADVLRLRPAGVDVPAPRQAPALEPVAEPLRY